MRIGHIILRMLGLEQPIEKCERIGCDKQIEYYNGYRWPSQFTSQVMPIGTPNGVCDAIIYSVPVCMRCGNADVTQTNIIQSEAIHTLQMSSINWIILKKTGCLTGDKLTDRELKLILPEEKLCQVI